MKLSDLGYSLVKSSTISNCFVYEEYINKQNNTRIYLNSKGHVYKYVLENYVEQEIKMSKKEKKAAMTRIEELKEILS